MGLTRLWSGAMLRGQWQRQLPVVVLIAFVGAVVFTCVAAARRTDSTYDRFIERHAIAELATSAELSGEELAAAEAAIAETPGVRTVGSWNGMYGAPSIDALVDGFLVVIPLDDEFGRVVNRPLVVAGRMPNPEAPDEVVMNERAADELGLDVGARTSLISIAPEEAQYLEGGEYEKIEFRGPTPEVHVVGVIRTLFDVQGAGYAPRYSLTSRAFAETYGDDIYGYGTQIEVDVEAGANLGEIERGMTDILGPTTPDFDIRRHEVGSTGIKDAKRVQSIALLLVALAAFLAGGLAIGQTIGRSVHEIGPDLATLAALGVDRNTRTRLVAALYAPLALVAAFLMIVASWIASRWFPTGVPRRIEVNPGMQFDVAVLLSGAALLVLGVVARAAWVARRYSVDAMRLRPPSRQSLLERLNPVFSPAVATGIRWAIGPRERARPRTGVIGAIVGVAGVLAALMYVGGIDHVVSDPEEYGASADGDAGGGNNPEAVAQIRDAVLARPEVGDVALVTVISQVTVDDRVVQGWAFDDVRGHIGAPVVHGRAPATDDEVLLGTKTAKDLHVGIGDVVNARRADGGDVALQVVGTGLFATLDSDQFTEGMVTTSATLAELDTSEPLQTVFIRWAPGVDAEEALERVAADGLFVTPLTPTADIENLKIVRDYPRWLAVFLAVLGLLATAHTLVVSTRRRRHETGILRALGFSLRQVRRAVTTQGATMGLLAIVIGVPCGILVGRWIWHEHADVIGIGNTIDVSVIGIAIAVVAALGLALALALASAWRQYRITAAEALRVE